MSLLIGSGLSACIDAAFADGQVIVGVSLIESTRCQALLLEYEREIAEFVRREPRRGDVPPLTLAERVLSQVRLEDPHGQLKKHSVVRSVGGTGMETGAVIRARVDGLRSGVDLVLTSSVDRVQLVLSVEDGEGSA